MPLYEYYCPTCASKYELLRPMGRSNEPGTCPKGHTTGARTITTFAAVTKGGSPGDVMGTPSRGGCACGGGGCGCAN